MPADITPPMTPAQVAGRVAEIIRSHPWAYDQAVWVGADVDVTPADLLAGLIAGPECGTPCCAAGWTAAVAAPEGSVIVLDFGMACVRLPDGTLVDVSEFAAKALGIPGWGLGSPWLFQSWNGREEVLAELDRIAAGGDPRG